MNVMKPFGMLFSQGEQYYLLNPNPLPLDSQWRDGTYCFFVATYRDGRATHIVTNAFCLQYEAHVEPIEVQGILEKEEWFKASLIEEETVKEDEALPF